ncbi:MAG: GNAT family N-acetyltransferase [Alphaproteobacteria bacterium]|nr:GNAT family N-acetyltransferase [Alphaproteobacteria bacterium]
MSATIIRRARPDDADHVVRLVKALAAYEHEPEETVRLTADDVRRDGFGERPRFEVVLAELAGEVVGFLLFFHNYSTWEGNAGLYIEDLFVEERARGHDLGRRLMAAAARSQRARLEPDARLLCSPGRTAHGHVAALPARSRRHRHPGGNCRRTLKEYIAIGGERVWARPLTS